MDRMILPILLAAAIFFAYWAYEQNANRSFTGLVSSAKAAETVKLGADGTGPDFYQDIEMALAKGKLEHKPVVAVITSYFCKYKSDFLTVVCADPRVERYHDRFIWLHVQAENTRAWSFVWKYSSFRMLRETPVIMYLRWDDQVIALHAYVQGETFANALEHVAGMVPAPYRVSEVNP